MAYLGDPFLLITPLLSRQWRRLLATMSGWDSANRPMTDIRARREAASLKECMYAFILARNNTNMSQSIPGERWEAVHHKLVSVGWSSIPADTITLGKWIVTIVAKIGVSLISTKCSKCRWVVKWGDESCRKKQMAPTYICMEWGRRACTVLWLLALVVLYGDIFSIII